MNPFEQYYNRYLKLKNELEKELNLTLANDLFKIIVEQPVRLNNIFMAGLGMGTLFLRMGAVVQMCEKLNKEPDNIKFQKIIADNLINQLPSEGNWLNIWKAAMDDQSQWGKFIKNTKGSKIHENFVSFRNSFVHEDIIIDTTHLKALQEGLAILDAFSKLYNSFEHIQIVESGTELTYVDGANQISLHPFVRNNKNHSKEEVGVLPYIFQGAYRKGVKFIGAAQGDESKEEQDADIDQKFNEIRKAISAFGGDNSFNHSLKIENYLECFVGREKELKAILDWIDSDTNENVLPIYAEAGMGKGALIAGVIDALNSKKTNVLYHFCGSGLSNNLQAVMYHFIVQGKDSGYWKDILSLKPSLNEKLSRLPTRYVDTIRLFQDFLKIKISENEIANARAIKNENGRYNALVKIAIALISEESPEYLEEIVDEIKSLVPVLTDKKQMNDKYYAYLFDFCCLCEEYEFHTNLIELIPENKRTHSESYKQRMVIIIDGLDEAAVAYRDRRISDLFYLYNDKDEREEAWIAPGNIKWIFTYRFMKDLPKIGYQFEKHEFKTASIPLLQPLQGLSREAAAEALLDLNLSAEFIDAIMTKGAV